MKAATMILVAGVWCLMSCSGSADQTLKAKGATGSSEVLKAPVLRVYSTKEGDFKFIAYIVKWKGTEVVVNDNLAVTNFTLETLYRFCSKIRTEGHKTSWSSYQDNQFPDRTV